MWDNFYNSSVQQINTKPSTPPVTKDECTSIINNTNKSYEVVNETSDMTTSTTLSSSDILMKVLPNEISTAPDNDVGR